MAAIPVYILLFSLVFIIISSDRVNRYVALLCGTILFPLGINFLQSPTFRPMDLFLYGFLVVCLFKEPDDFFEAIRAFPLKIPLFLILTSHFFSVYVNEGFSAKQFYACIREFIELYGYLFGAFIVGRRCNYNSYSKKLIYITIGLSILGILEILLQGNYPYTYICRAFPIYTGYYHLEDIVTCIQDWRIRSMITTAHPTALGTLLCGLTVFFTAQVDKVGWKNSKLTLIFVLLAINLFLCGSRTGMLCAALGLFIYFMKDKHLLLRIAIVGIFLMSSTLYINALVDEFSQQGRGSSITLRQQQLLFTLFQIERSPIFGNGVGYTKNVFEYNDDGQVINDADIGGLESIIFRSLIDYGFVGLAAYYLFMLWLFILFFIRRKDNSLASTGYVLVFSSTLFFTLSGHIGNNTAFIFLLEGLLLGNVYITQEEHEKIELEQIREKMKDDLHDHKSREG